MFITHDMLVEQGSCQEGIDFFDRFAPDGAELADMLKFRHVPPTYLHWLVNHFTTTQEERQIYASMVKVINSTNYFQCQDIENCDMITNSQNVKNSNYIYHCTDIENSSDIRQSYKVKDSNMVAYSNAIYNSSQIVHSSNIKQSTNVLKGSFIINSTGVYDSSLITDSKIILQSRNLQQSMFMMGCYDSHNCLFCADINNASYQIFNHPIDATQWEFIAKELAEFIEENPTLALFDAWDKENSEALVVSHQSYLVMFEQLLKDEYFVKWIKQLPFYSDMIAYKITFHPSFLKQT